MEKRLYRSRRNRVICGVCGGIGEYFNIDPTIVRILWIVISFAGGAGLIAYIISAIVIPESSEGPYQSGYDANSHSQGADSDDGRNDWNGRGKFNSTRSNIVLGGALILIGILFLAKQILPWVSFHLIFPGILIIIGIALLFRGRSY